MVIDRMMIVIGNFFSEMVNSVVSVRLLSVFDWVFGFLISVCIVVSVRMIC